MSVVTDLVSALGPEVVLVGDRVADFTQDERGLFTGTPSAVVLPRNIDEVARAMEICAEHKVGVVPQGGGTGLVGGGVPGEGEVVVNLRRMNRVRRVDDEGFTMEVEAGCVLADVHAAADRAERFFPLNLASAGSCQIGGNIATNAGGVNVLRYGMTRELVLGLEVVLPDGQVWHGLRGLRKDNTGYSMHQLFVGSEGTLGIITAAVLRLFPKQRQHATALLALPGHAELGPLLALARHALDDRLSSMELLPRTGVELVLEHVPGTRDPFRMVHPCYVLVETSSARSGSELRDQLESFVEQAEGLVTDAVIAQDAATARQLWALRENLSEAQKRAGGAIKHDVSVRLDAVPDFIQRASARIAEAFPGARPIALGHVGDGNVHFNVLPPPGRSARDHELWRDVGKVVNEIVADMNGSISAEHGVGQLKRAALAAIKPAVELRLQRAVKAALDPAGIMNPGKVLA